MCLPVAEVSQKMFCLACASKIEDEQNIFMGDSQCIGRDGVWCIVANSRLTTPSGQTIYAKSSDLENEVVGDLN